MVNKRPDHTNKSRWLSMSPEQKARRLETMYAWQKANPDKVKAAQAKARAKAKAKYKGKGRPTGYGTYQAAKKYDYVRDAKIQVGECADCGFPCDDVTHVCFAWDHIEPCTKAFSLSKAHKYSWEQIDAEIAKCELVCHNCHAIRTYLEGHNRTELRQLTDETQPTLFD